MSNKMYTSKKIHDKEKGVFMMLDDEGRMIAVKNDASENSNWWSTFGSLIRDTRITEAYDNAPVEE